MPGPSTPRSGSPSTSTSKASGPRSAASAMPTTVRMMVEHQRALQGRVHPHHGLPPRPLQDAGRRRIRHRRLGRLVQPATTPRVSWHDQSHRVRNRPLRDPHPRAATRMRAARNLGRFTCNNPPRVRLDRPGPARRRNDANSPRRRTAATLRTHPNLCAAASTLHWTRFDLEHKHRGRTWSRSVSASRTLSHRPWHSRLSQRPQRQDPCLRHRLERRL
jgi:hypothetical protein